MLDFADSVSQLENWEKGRALLVYGADNTFCSGGDLDLMKALLEEPEGGARMSAFMHDTLLRYHIFILAWRVKLVHVLTRCGPFWRGKSQLLFQ